MFPRVSFANLPLNYRRQLAGGGVQGPWAGSGLEPGVPRLISDLDQLAVVPSLIPPRHEVSAASHLQPPPKERSSHC